MTRQTEAWPVQTLLVEDDSGRMAESPEETESRKPCDGVTCGSSDGPAGGGIDCVGLMLIDDSD